MTQTQIVILIFVAYIMIYYLYDSIRSSHRTPTIKNMMNKEELTKYKEGLEAQLKAAEQGLERVKLDIAWKKRMIKLTESQVAALPEEKEKV